MDSDEIELLYPDADFRGKLEDLQGWGIQRARKGEEFTAIVEEEDILFVLEFKPQSWFDHEDTSVEEIREFIPFDKAAIYHKTQDPGRESMEELLAHIGFDDEEVAMNREIRLGGGALGTALEEGSVIIISDLSNVQNEINVFDKDHTQIAIPLYSTKRKPQKFKKDFYQISFVERDS